ncbi:MAG: hypothetical protein KDM81_17450 [Verrucomicrobiae bacterium]|nr:hypothetical protein [Verrucomicrobiae bacterium]
MWLKTAGDKNIALMLAAAVALATLAWQQRAGLRALSNAVGVALASGGVIILITAAGGGFGTVLRETAIAWRIEELFPATQSLAMLPIAFLVTTLVRTAQGSATVAMITAVSIVAPLVPADPAELGFHPVYVALAIGCGSKPFAWMNDSGFWVVCKLSGFTEKETLKSWTIIATTSSVVGVLTCWALSKVIPGVGTG